MAKKYEFDNAVKLERDSTTCKYIVKVNDKETNTAGFTENELKNPYITYVRFCNEISNHMREKIKTYLKKTGQNIVTGCAIDMKCKDCIKQGLHEAADSNCCERSPEKLIERSKYYKY